MMRNRRSPDEWSSSGKVVESGSSKTVAASRKSTPCFLRFSSAFRGSQVNVTGSVYVLSDRRAQAAQLVSRLRGRAYPVAAQQGRSASQFTERKAILAGTPPTARHGYVPGRFPETLRQTVDPRGCASALARIQRATGGSRRCKRFMGGLFRPKRLPRSTVDTREARAYPRHSRSIGLFTPSAPRFITWRPIIVVLTSRRPSRTCAESDIGPARPHGVRARPRHQETAIDVERRVWDRVSRIDGEA